MRVSQISDHLELPVSLLSAHQEVSCCGCARHQTSAQDHVERVVTAPGIIKYYQFNYYY